MMIRMRAIVSGAVLTLGASAVAACGGGGAAAGLAPAPAPSTVPTTTPSSGRTGTLTLIIPRKTNSAQRSAKYVSTNTAAVRITVKTVNGQPPTSLQVPQNPSTVALMTGQGGNCTVVPSGEACIIAIPAPTGSVVYQVDLLDTGGNTLATNTVTVAIAAGSSNPTFTVQLDAQAGNAGCPNPSIVIASIPSGASGSQCSGSSQGTIVLTTSSTVTLPVTITDGSGAAIQPDSPGAVKLGATQTGDIVAASVSQNPYRVTLAPLKSGTGTVTVTASGASAGDGAVQRSVTFTVAYPWTTKASLLLPRSRFGAAAVNNRVYAIAGWGTIPGGGGGFYANDVEAYDPSTDTWTVKAPFSFVRFGLGVAAIDNVLYTVGGADICCDQTGAVEAFDTSTNTWTTKAGMHSLRSDLGVAVIRKILYAVGGTQFINPFDLPHMIVSNMVEAYDPSTNTWTNRAPMPTARTELAVGVVNNVLYAVGGNGTAGQANIVEAYDPATNTWTTKAPMPTARMGLTVGVVNNILYAVGGYQTAPVFRRLDTVEAYDPATNTWTTKPPMPTPRAQLAAGVVNNVLYAMGGGEGTHVPLATVEAYTP